MNYTVVWREAAEEDVLAIWSAAADSAEVAHAATEIHKLLGNDPENVGESRSGAYRLLFFPPLAVRFIVSPDDRLVTVTAVWAPRRR